MRRVTWRLVFALVSCFGIVSVVLGGELENRLLDAAGKGDTNVVKAMLERGADVNAKDNEGETALRLAVTSGKTDVVKLLIEKGADVNAISEDVLFGGTALMLAAVFGNMNMVQTLLDNGADVNAEDKNGITALMNAAFNGYLGIVRVLIERGADVNSNEYGRTALIQAADRGHADVVRLLVEKGADVNARSKDGMTALMTANEIIEKGKFGAVGKNGKMLREPLPPAEKKKYEGIVRTLKAAGAKWNFITIALMI